ncbi:hypothetical protein NC651_038268 [Populus alba x Populus x berolinensis]|nr:hypothetical protein NC651_038268 [Populus alba x Populus x berolinensis]
MNAHKLILVLPLLTTFSLSTSHHNKHRHHILPSNILTNPTKNPRPQAETSSSSSSSTTTSQSFTQGRFPLSNSPPRQPIRPKPDLNQRSTFLQQLAPLVQSTNLQELLHMAELQLTKGLESEQLSALYFLEHSLVSDAPSHQAVVEVAMELNGFPAERALAALELTLP